MLTTLGVKSPLGSSTSATGYAVQRIRKTRIYGKTSSKYQATKKAGS
jgi:hypothetical protein